MGAQPIAIRSGDGQLFQFPGPNEARDFEAKTRVAGGEVERLEPAAPRLAKPLYDLETQLAALIDTEALISEDQEREYQLELHATLLAAEEKRDRVAQFMGWLESQTSFAKAEAKRLEDRAAFYERSLERLKSYVMRVIESLGVDERGKRNRLVGKTSTMWLHGCDKRLEIADATAVPTRFKRAVVTLPLEIWEVLLETIDLDLRDQVLTEAKVLQEVNSSVAKAALKAGENVPGTRLLGGVYLVRT